MLSFKTVKMNRLAELVNTNLSQLSTELFEVLDQWKGSHLGFKQGKDIYSNEQEKVSFYTCKLRINYRTMSTGFYKSIECWGRFYLVLRSRTEMWAAFTRPGNNCC